MNIEELAAQAAEEEDCSVASSTGGDFEIELPEAGPCVLRFREYIELGLTKLATKKYPKKKPAVMTRWVFELTTPKHVKEIELEDGTKKRFGQVISIMLPKSLASKSNYFKLFKQLNWEGSAKHPAQLLGKPYKARIIHAYAAEDAPGGVPNKDAKPKWANLKDDTGFTFEAPRTVDPLSETITEIPVPEMLGDKKLFLWNMPTKETWDSLFIDGEYEKEVDGKKETISKNWIQNKILEALDYEGSKLHELLVGNGETLDDLPAEEPKKEEPKGEEDIDALLGV